MTEQRERIDVEKIHRTLGADGWVRVLQRLGLEDCYLRNRHGPCPACGGKDRYRFDNKRGRGDFYCTQCEPGDGIKLVMNWQGMQFVQACKLVIEVGGIDGATSNYRPTPPIRSQAPQQPAMPTQRVRALLREACLVEDCESAMRYLKARGLWPLPRMHKLRAHPSVDYWQEGERVGHHPALLASVRDVNGEVVTAHVTYLQDHGAKISTHEARKILSPMTGREGCCVRLMHFEDGALGIAEGIETAFSAAALHGMPVWAALNTSLLAKFEPPPQVTHMVIFADRDIAGIDAAAALMQRLQGRVTFELQMPKTGDWNDVLMERMS